METLARQFRLTIAHVCPTFMFIVKKRLDKQNQTFIDHSVIEKDITRNVGDIHRWESTTVRTVPER
jgi:hypothetical protein